MEKGKDYWLACLLKRKGNLLHRMSCNPSNADIYPIKVTHSKRAVPINLLMVKVLV